MAKPEDKAVKERGRKPLKWIFHYSGLEFIYRKFKPLEKSQLPTGVIWLIGIYVAFFGVASQRYENRVDKIENRANSIFTQLATPAYKKALGRISRVQNMPCPYRPKILRPVSIFRSLFLKDTEYTEMVDLLRETIENWKDSLDGVKLNGANLEKANLEGANLKGAKLGRANLERAYLWKANLEGAALWKANLNAATLQEANLKGANLDRANLRGANLRGANLEEPTLWKPTLREPTFGKP